MTNRHHPDTPPARLVIGGEPIDLRTREARRFASSVADLLDQLGTEPTAAERMQVTAAATLLALVERGTLQAITNDPEFSAEEFRRNTTALRAILTGLGLAMKSRDIKKSDLKRGPSLLSTLIEGEAIPAR